MGVHQESEQVYLRIKELLDIPAHEPIFILRAQDKFAVDTIRDYRKRVRDGQKQRPKGYVKWMANMGEILNRFTAWQKSNKEKVKVPD